MGASRPPLPHELSFPVQHLSVYRRRDLTHSSARGVGPGNARSRMEPTLGTAVRPESGCLNIPERRAVGTETGRIP
jgi:hypothetical protein